MRTVASSGLSLLLLFLMVERSSAQYTCSDPCRPPGWGITLQNGGIYQFDTSSLGGSASAFYSAMLEWQNALNVGNFSVDYVLGSGDWVVSFENSFVGTGTWAQTDWGAKTIRINPDTLSWSGFFFKVALHELGHASGFGDVTDANCGMSTSIMKSGWSGGQGASALTSADQCGINERYYIRDESPIIIDIDGDSIHLTGPEVLFDVANDESPNFMGWTQGGSMDGFLVRDRNGDGHINNGSEMFGNFTPLSLTAFGPLARHGYDALAWFDAPAQGGNGDGVITGDDPVFPSLRLWIDDNHDGRSQTKELFRLSDMGVIGIEVDPKESRRRDGAGNEFRYRAKVYQRDPRGHVVTRFSYDVFLTSF